MHRRGPLLALVLVCSVYAACEAPPVEDAGIAGDADEAPAVSVAPPVTVSAAPRRVGCIRGGFTPDELRAALGEPDSIAGGWWFYGRTRVQLSYGTVQDWNDADSLVAC
jgi:hypothetical protein